jgi:hypothetical protein
MMFGKASLFALMPLVASAATATTASVGESHRTMIVKTLERNARSVLALQRDGLQGRRRMEESLVGDDQSLCDFLETMMTSGLVEAGVIDGGCTCNEDDEDTLQLECAVDQICVPESDDTEPICSSLYFAMMMSGLVDETVDPELTLNICVFTDVEWFDDICLSMVFDFEELAPTGCGLTYGDELCICTVDPESLCITADCTEVAPEALAEYMSFNTCDDSEQDLTGALTVFESGVPAEVAQDMEANQAENGGSPAGGDGGSSAGGDGGSSAATSTSSFGAAAAVILAVGMVA